MKRIAHPLLTATHGTQREIVSEHFGPDVYTRKVYIQACLHADETPAMLVATDLRQRLLALEAAGRLTAQIVLVPVANPAGLAQFVMGAPSGRFELASGRNYNRDFPFPLEAILQRVEGELTDDAQHNLKAVRAAWQQSLEAIAPRDEMASLQRRLMLLAHDADLVLDLHCSREAVMHLYTSEWSWEQVEPLASWPVLRSAPRRLFSRGGALGLPPTQIKHWLPFALRMARAAQRVDHGREALRSLLTNALPMAVP